MTKHSFHDLSNYLPLACAITLGTVYLSQYGFGLSPCHLCLWQRVPWWVIFFLSLVNHYSSTFTIHQQAYRIKGLLFLLISLSLLSSLGLGIYHAGVEYGWWLGPQTCSGAGNRPTAQDFNNLLALANQAPPVPCGVPAFTLGGVSMAGMNALWSGLWVVIWLSSYRKAIK